MNGKETRHNNSQTTTAQALWTQAPPVLVESGDVAFGSWRGIPRAANLLDTQKPYRYPIPLFLKRLRLKEWRAIQAGDGEWFLMAVVYDAKFLSMASFDLWNRVEKKKYSFRHIFLGSHFSISPNLVPSSVQVRAGHDFLSIDVSSDPEIVRLRALRFSKHRAPDSNFDVELAIPLSSDKSSAFSVCLPLGVNRAIYSTKLLAMSSGTISVQEATHNFEPKNCVAALDDSKGYYPYRLHYDWVSAFGTDAGGRPVGFNLTDNQVRDQGRYNENRLWIGDEIFQLPPIKITRPYGPDSSWVIQDTEGMVDLVFTPEALHTIRMKFGILDLEYFGPFGRFEGYIHSPSGDKLDASRLYGMGEDNSLRL